ncbi:MAG: cyclic nucleotide-binding domain-containing protein [Betaproteobacteria bacterium]|nr:cyclic nucleotide-binding domain-containing protein [Betaproteobacteria bacterium]
MVKQGEIFGELAVIAGLPRSATAMAKADCKVLSLDESSSMPRCKRPRNSR